MHQSPTSCNWHWISGLAVVWSFGVNVGRASAADPPALSEVVAIAGLSGPASASIDGLGVPLIDAASSSDALIVEGYLHARERYAQMDLMRRLAAGELAELLGPLASSVDRKQRVMRLRVAAEGHVASLNPKHRALLSAYVQGVNAGLASLESPPAEHRLLQIKPTPWTEADSLLVALSMCAMLNDRARIELAMESVTAVLPPEMLAYLSCAVSSFDAPVIADHAAPVLPNVPGPEVLDSRGVTVGPIAAASSEERDTSTLGAEEFNGDRALGSNAWLVAGSRTATGAAILANDMHLAITVPGVWYRASLRYRTDSAASPVQIDGISLPGAPGIVSGSNGTIAWGFTNSEGDFIDFVVIELDPSDSSKYLVPGGSEAFRIHSEVLRVRGMADQSIEVTETRWGPVVAMDASGRPLALHWTALEENGVNLDLLDLAEATSVRAALDVAARWRGAQQNVMVAGANGDIGWTISGALPKRTGFDGSVPTSWADGTRGWQGMLEGAERPRVENPADGVIVTANQRPVPVERAQQLGNLWAEADRASRIRELVAQSSKYDETALAAIQLDTAVPRLMMWRDVVLSALERGARDTAVDGQPTDLARKLLPIADALRSWNGKADADERAVAVMEKLRHRLSRAILRGILETAIAEVEPALSPEDRGKRADKLLRIPARDEPVFRIVRDRPQHLLPPGETSWDAFIQRTARESLAGTSSKDGLLRWGQVNVTDFAHPLAQANPILAAQFGIAAHEQAGHPLAVRVAAPKFGASDRLIVSPGHESNGLIQTPSGQSGDPKSPHYSDLHASWRDGQPLPLRPGQVVTRIEFSPTR